ncbi:MAG: hypothetical protein R2875_11295 [Desulfobacterales bacterium]
MVSGIGMPALQPYGGVSGKSSPSTRQAFSSIFLNTELPSITLEHPVVIKAGNASGKLIGGNLATLCHLIGTPFMPDLSGHILLLEDVGELPYRIDRMLVQMKMAGCFDRLAGIVLGSFKNCGDRMIYMKYSMIFLKLLRFRSWQVLMWAMMNPIFACRLASAPLSTPAQHGWRLWNPCFPDP